MSRDPARAELDARVLAWMRERDPRPDEARFDALARALFAYQLERCPAYARFCRGRGRTSSMLRSWRDIPAVPAGAFKELALRSFSEPRVVKRFRTSGTTTGRRGTLELDTLELYEASLAWSFSRFVLPDLAALGGRIRVRILAPSPEEAPDSSLSHMFGCVLARFGAAESSFDIRAGRLRFAPLWRALERAVEEDVPVALCGTAFAFVHLIDEAQRRAVRIRLPESTRIMETGGFKGRSRTLPREALYAALEATLGVAPVRIVNQYGMTELGSQFYDGILAEPGTPRIKRCPPWARVRIVDPGSGRDVGSGEKGAIQIVDLANTGSVLCVQPSDVGRAEAGGFEVLGREAEAEPRGCSMAADDLLGRAEP